MIVVLSAFAQQLMATSCHVRNQLHFHVSKAKVSLLAHLQCEPAIRGGEVRLQGALQARPAGGSWSAGTHRLTACEQPQTCAGITEFTWALVAD
jgi:hypothetical protein